MILVWWPGFPHCSTIAARLRSGQRSLSLHCSLECRPSRLRSQAAKSFPVLQLKWGYQGFASSQRSDLPYYSTGWRRGALQESAFIWTGALLSVTLYLSEEMSGNFILWDPRFTPIKNCWRDYGLEQPETLFQCILFLDQLVFVTHDFCPDRVHSML